jgi:hypothetical protein
VTPEYDDVPVEGVIEKWDPKLKTSQIKTIKISPMFGADVVRLYKEANEAHPATTVVKSQEAAESLRAVVGMDMDCCNMNYMHDLQNMQNMLLLSSTSRALGRSALLCCGGHVRTLSSRNIESVLILQCTTRRSA